MAQDVATYPKEGVRLAGESNGTPPIMNGSGGGNDPFDGWNGNPAIATGQVVLWFFLATVIMLFAGFTSAYLVRQFTGNDWMTIPLPSFLWISTGILAISSITLEFARSKTSAGDLGSARGWLIGTIILGILFLASQYEAWQQLSAQGVFVPSNPHSAFFYILTGAHALHLGGGLFGLIYTMVKNTADATERKRETRMKVISTYWHFFGVLWVLLFLVLFTL